MRQTSRRGLEGREARRVADPEQAALDSQIGERADDHTGKRRRHGGELSEAILMTGVANERRRRRQRVTWWRDRETGSARRMHEGADRTADRLTQPDTRTRQRRAEAASTAPGGVATNRNSGGSGDGCDRGTARDRSHAAGGRPHHRLCNGLRARDADAPRAYGQRRVADTSEQQDAATAPAILTERYGAGKREPNQTGRSGGRRGSNCARRWTDGASLSKAPPRAARSDGRGGAPTASGAPAGIATGIRRTDEGPHGPRRRDRTARGSDADRREPVREPPH